MTLIQVPKIFDVSLLSRSKILGDIQPLVDYLSQFTENIVRALQNGIAVADNLDSLVKTVSLSSGTATIIGLPSSRVPIGVLVLKQTTTTNPITSFVWQMTDSAQLQVTATFLTSNSTAPSAVTLMILFS